MSRGPALVAGASSGIGVAFEPVAAATPGMIEETRTVEMPARFRR